jgi:PAS domain S-box-containing protein
MPKYAKRSKAQLIQQLQALQDQLKGKRGKSTPQLAHDLQVHQIELEMQNRELREAQQQLEAARDRYADLYDFAPVGYLSMDEHGRILEINLTAAGMLGVERARLIGRHLTAWLHNKSIPDFRSHLHTARHSRGKAVFETRIRQRDGGLLDVRLETLAIEALDNDETRYHTALLDISERKRAKEALTRQRDFAESLIATAPVAVLVLDPSGHIRRINPFLEALSGYSLEEVQGKDWFETFLRSADKTAARAVFSRAISDQPTRGNLTPLITRDGRERIFEWFDTTLKDTEGRTTGLLAIGLDVTQRKRAENALHEERNFLAVVLDTIAALVVVLDPSGRIVRFNRACENATGYTFAEVENRNFWDVLVLPEEVDGVKATFAELLAGAPTNAHQNFWATKEGGRRLIDWSNTILRDQDGAAQFVIGTGIDITEKKRIEEQLHQHEAELAHLARVTMLNELASGLAHEIGQPLTAIASYTQECLRHLHEGRADSPRLQNAMEQVYGQALRATAIIQHLRSFAAKHTAGRAPADINHLVRRAVSLIRPMAMKSGIAMRLNLATDLPMLTVDSLQIEQVILNLLQNAIDAMADTGSAKREVTITTSAETGREVAVSVSDLGAGLSMADNERIFEAFFTTKPKGMGMGLAISRSIIEAHGGRMSAFPNRSHGATFRFELPMSAQPHDRQTDHLRRR